MSDPSEAIERLSKVEHWTDVAYYETEERGLIDDIAAVLAELERLQAENKTLTRHNSKYEDNFRSAAKSQERRQQRIAELEALTDPCPVKCFENTMPNMNEARYYVAGAPCKRCGGVGRVERQPETDREWPTDPSNLVAVSEGLEANPEHTQYGTGTTSEKE